MIAWLLALGAGATSTPAALERYISTSWTRKDGLPSTLIYAITQTRDGFLWLGTSDGLVRFDGINFVHQRLFSEGNLLLGPVTALCAGRDGALWVGSSSGVVMRLSGTLRQKYSLGAEIEAVAEAPRGSIWAVAQNGLYRFEQGPRGELELRDRMDPMRISRLVKPAANQLLLDSIALVQTPDGSPTYEHRVTIGARTFLFKRDNNGRIWLGTQPFSRDHAILAALRDGRGFLWAGSSSSGLLRKKDEDGQPETELQRDLIECLFEDREGDIWVGTNNGLFAFRFGKVSRMTARDGLSTDMVSSIETTGKTVWVGTQTSLNRIDDTHVDQYLRGLEVSVVKAAQQGQIWAATQKGVFTIDATHQPAQPRHITGDLLSVTAIEKGPAGCVWLLDAQKGLYLWKDRGKDGALLPITSDWAGNGRKISAIRGQRDGALWVGFSDGGLGVYKSGSFKQIPLTKPPVGTVYDIYIDDGMRGDSTIWVATDTGLYRSAGQTFAVWNFDKGLPGDRVLWLRAEGDDTFWLGFSTGVARVHRADLKVSRQDTASKISPDFYDSGDGLVANPVRRSQAAATLDSEGKLWLTTSAGIAMIDSHHINKNTVAPPVVIERMMADNREIPARSPMHLPALTKNLEIDYNGLSLVEPRKVQFRYRLEGFEKDWQNAGARRQAFYTNLSPGSYRFQVKAANNDNAWNETGATVEFAVLPAFYQTRLFSILCALAAIAIAWGIYRLRLQQVQAALKSRFEERLSERTRIAQDLHDELLQSAMGVSLQIELTDELMEERHAAKPHLERALMLSRTLLQQGRQVLRDLREKARDAADISGRLTKTIEDMRQQEGPDSRLTVEGQPRPVNPVVAEDFVHIGCEAIRNAFRHASATSVDIYLIYKAGELCLEVQDNGCGMEPEIMAAGMPGHYGLTGMRERAERIGATLTIASRVREGTKVAVSVPGKHAYIEE